MSICRWLFSLPTYKFSCWPPNPPDTLTTWTRRWQMEFNASKCKILLSVYLLYLKPLLLPDVCHPFRDRWATQLLRSVSTSQTIWQPHIDSICNKANCLLGFLHRNLRHCPSKLKKCAYKQILLILEYCSPIWDTYQHKSIHKIEMIQQRAAQFILNQP